MRKGREGKGLMEDNLEFSLNKFHTHKS